MRRASLVAVVIATLLILTIGAARTSTPPDIEPHLDRAALNTSMQRVDGAIDYLLDRLEGKSQHGFIVR